MNQLLGSAVVLWTGGKDSCLALYEAQSLGYEIKGLITFAPSNPRFLAHPVHVMKYQAEALQILHRTIEITQPFNEVYKSALRSLKEQRGVSVVITGDIDEIRAHPNWVKECAAFVGIEVVTPLWKRNRKELLEKLITNNFKVIFSCVKRPLLTDSWPGCDLDTKAAERLYEISEETGMDLCGENGEYHTTVLDFPLFRRTIVLNDFSKETKDSMMYLKVKKLSLVNK
ncbi:MAG: diphthine--ammonia ligase [Ignavibacteriales bacterium]|nr:diphthine--ammonia ligase [Ignavibacteriales bacterium]